MFGDIFRGKYDTIKDAYKELIKLEENVNAFDIFEAIANKVESVKNDETKMKTIKIEFKEEIFFSDLNRLFKDARIEINGIEK